MERVVCCLFVVLVCVYWKAQGNDDCQTYDIGAVFELIVQLKTELLSMQEKMKKLDALEKKSDQCDEIQEKLTLQEKRIEALEKKNEALGFSAKRPKKISSGVMIFKDTNVNTDGSYSLETGVFTCRIPGYYYFSATLLKRDSYDHYASCKLRKNGGDLVKAFTQPGSKPHRGWTTAVTGVYVNLAKGDTVTLEDCSELESWAIDGSSFNGFLVTPATA